MKKAIILVFALISLITLYGCSHVSIPEIEYFTYEEQQYPVLQSDDESEVVDTINKEIEAQFRRLVDGVTDDGVVESFITTTDQMVSILLKTSYDTAYGTDGEIWGICYDYAEKTIVPCGAYLARIGEFSTIYENICSKLRDEGTFEYIDMQYYGFDSNTNPIFVVVALEHPHGADAWKRIYYYDINKDSFIECPWISQ